MFSQKLLKQIPLPALILDIDAFDENCKQIANKANGKRIRIATKSIRSVDVLKRILDSNPVFEGLMCFTPFEALFLRNKGFDDILLGYPCYDEKALSMIAESNKEGTKIICMVDSIEHLTYLNRIAQKTSGQFYVCIDIDMSTKFATLHFGVRRSPITNVDGVLSLAKKLKQCNRVKLVGIMGYEAQIAGVGDRMPAQAIKNKAVAYMQKKSISIIEKRRQDIVRALQEEGIILEFVNGGGTGSLQTTCHEEVVTEVTVGSGFYSPLLFDYYSAFKFNPALYFALPVVRKPTANIYTCLGGGYVASGPAGNDKMPQPIFPVGGKLLPLEGAGEVQTPVYFESEELQIGDAVVFRAAKAGEICERFQEMICISNNEITERFTTYRGDGVCFL